MKIYSPNIIDSDLKIRPEETQIQRLSRWANIYGDFKVAYSYKDSKGDHHFSTHRSVLKCLETDEGISFLNKANHRQIMPTELVLDLDDEPTLEKFSKICNELDLFGCCFYGYHTGSKGYHIHIFDYEFIYYKFREIIKETIIDFFNCDLHKKSENVMIAMEGKSHWKTGNEKRLLRWVQ